MEGHRQTGAGYDSPVSKREEDQLDRWRFASEILDIVRDAPRDWSVRLGVYGKWGEGKTSVLRFLEGMATSEGHIVLWFNPWAARDRNELWIEFASRLMDRMDEAKIAVEGVFKPKWKALWHKLTEPFGEGRERAADFHDYARALVGGSLSALGNLLRIDGATLANIHAALGEKRVIVLIDDLDRTDPRLIPHLLLTLREMLDIPGFAFVLAFDADMVAKALREYHSAWATGFEFLEKIVDFPMYLPEPSAQQRKRLLLRELERGCEFIDQPMLDEVDDLLPYNPRKLKLLLRNLSVLKGQVERHDMDELDWLSILVSQLVGLESESFLQQFLNHPVSERILILDRYRSSAPDAAPAAEDDALEALLDDVEISDTERRLRLRKLIQAWATRNGLDSVEALRYQVQLAARPHALTWKEFRGFFLNHWKLQKQPSDVNFWVTQHAAHRSTSCTEVACELFDTTLMYREELLARAAESTLLEEQEEAMAEAADSLSLLEILLLEGLKCVGQTFFATGDNFSSLLAMVERWSGVQDNPSDLMAREQERRLLMRCVEQRPGDPVVWMESIQPWTHGLADAAKRFRVELAGRLEPAVAEQVLAAFEQKGGIARMREPGKKLAHKYLALRSTSALYRPPLRERFVSLLDKAGQDSVVHRSCVDFLGLLCDAAEHGSEVADREQVRGLVGSSEIIGPLWQAILARKVQARATGALIGWRALLQEVGVSESLLPAPPWLPSSSP